MKYISSLVKLNMSSSNAALWVILFLATCSKRLQFNGLHLGEGDYIVLFLIMAELSSVDLEHIYLFK